MATDFRGPKITIDGGPQIERGPQYRVLIGASRKKARWVRVNVAQWAGCAEGDRWNGVLCSKFDLQLPQAPAVGTRQVVLLAVGAAMVAVPILAAVTSGKQQR